MYRGRYATQAPSVSGISGTGDSDIPESCRIPEFDVQTQHRRCPCGRKIARISNSTICQRCIDLDFAARFHETKFRGKEPTLAEMIRERGK